MAQRTVYLETFGCQMNELDSELVAGQLRALGYAFTTDSQSADVVLYNTCSVREQAEQKVWSRLGELKSRKQDQPGLVVGVLGCLAERDGIDLIKRMPVVDVMCGPGELDKLPSLLDNAVRTKLEGTETETGKKKEPVSAKQVALQGNTSRRSTTLAAAEDSLELLDLSRSVSPTDHGGTAYVRITRGCNKFCTYCVVPFTRGAEIHRPPEHIIEECKRLADAGVIEVTLLGQTVNHYRFEHGAAVTLGGVVQPQKGRAYTGGHRADPFRGAGVTTFADLLARIHDEVPGIRRLRFVTSYPRDFGDDVLQVIRDHPRICRYLHVPAQSGSDRMLKMMNRGYESSEYLEFIDRARSALDQPEIGRPLMISGDFIVGFPTETEDDFERTIQLVERVRYKNSFIFKYSPRPGTVAFDKIPDDVPEDVKRRRNNTLLAVQARISDEIAREQVGRTFDLMIEGVSKQEQKRRGATHGQIRKNNAVMLTVGGKGMNPDDPDSGCGSGCRHVHGEDGTESASGASDPLGTGEMVQLAGRTDGDLIVFVDSPGAAATGMIGRIVPVRVTSADKLVLRGEVV
ncbi:MAG: MiaB/RimO family radical SAM methylthiotransferase [Phycisphaeraceae bacterium]|nr:MiaB/RimO family radical SAM methylthiotransferase [Phycisphaeraceae bacterium]